MRRESSEQRQQLFAYMHIRSSCYRSPLPVESVCGMEGEPIRKKRVSMLCAMTTWLGSIHSWRESVTSDVILAGEGSHGPQSVASHPQIEAQTVFKTAYFLVRRMISAIPSAMADRRPTVPCRSPLSLPLSLPSHPYWTSSSPSAMALRRLTS